MSGAPTGIRILWVIALILGATSHAYSENKYAENFEIQDKGTHKLLHVNNPWRGADDVSFSYALVPKDAPLPELSGDVSIIRTPVERVIIMATTYLGPIQSLNLHDRLTGVAHLEFTYDPKVHELVKAGNIEAVQGNAALDIESILKFEPDLVLTSSTGNALYDTHPKLKRAKLPVVLTASYMEGHPLARSEWIKVMATFVDMDAKAYAIFDDVEAQYLALASLTSGIENKPVIFANAPFAGVWHIPGGRSYNAQAFRDAGAEYLWANNLSHGGVPLDFEVILLKATNADIWINPGRYDNLQSLLELDERFTDFRAFREGKVFNNTVRVNEHGGNDIWEKGIDRPHEVLAYMIKIFHPYLLPDHEFIYYEQLK